MTTKELVYKPATSLFLPTLCLTCLLQLLCAARGPASRMPEPVHTNENSLHNSSRSRSPPCFHRFSLARTAEQAEHVLATGILLRSWFGDGRSVLVKNSLETAVEAFVAARQEDPVRVGPSILSGQCLGGAWHRL